MSAILPELFPAGDGQVGPRSACASTSRSLLADERDARANQVLKRLQVVPLTESLARSAAELKRLAGMTGMAATIDAVVVATSTAVGGGVVLTSDVDDVRALASGATGIRIRPLRV